MNLDVEPKEGSVKLHILGAGQTIGKSCFLLSIDNHHILLDCGSFVGKTSSSGLPLFKKLPVPINEISAVLITHCHMDHCGGLPYIVHCLNYGGPIFMSTPSKAILVPLLYNFLPVLSSQANTKFDMQSIASLSGRVSDVSFKQTVHLNPHVSFTAHIAGHVLGSVMWEVCIHNRRVLYTGDFSSEIGSLIPPACFPSNCPRHAVDVLIMECTYGNTKFVSRQSREEQLVNTIVRTFEKGGKVLIPSHAFGSSQELISIFMDVWKKHSWNFPIYYSSPLSQSLLPYFSQFSSWTTGRLSVKSDFIQRFQMSFMDSENPYLLLATPPQLNSGVSAQALKSFVRDPNSCIIMLGNSSEDSPSGQLSSGKLEVQNESVVVQCSTETIPFSAHPDRIACCELIQSVGPKVVVFVHGDKKCASAIIKHYPKYCKASPSSSSSSVEGPQFFIPETGASLEFSTSLSGVENAFASRKMMNRLVVDEPYWNRLRKGIVMHDPMKASCDDASNVNPKPEMQDILVCKHRRMFNASSVHDIQSILMNNGNQDDQYNGPSLYRLQHRITYSLLNDTAFSSIIQYISEHVSPMSVSEPIHTGSKSLLSFRDIKIFFDHDVGEFILEWNTPNGVIEKLKDFILKQLS